MINLMNDLYDLDRTLINPDNEKALSMIKEYIDDNKNWKIHSYPSHSKCWDWVVPKGWKVNHAVLKEAESGKIIADYSQHRLHIPSYSTSFKGELSLEELKPHLYFNEERPDDIPFKYFYYQEKWGFSLEYNKRKSLKDVKYIVDIDTEFYDSSLEVGEYTSAGNSEKIVYIITNICHPAQVSDSIAGVVVGAEIARKLKELDHRFTYKILFLPETIGSICYFSSDKFNKDNTEYGIFFEMLGNKEPITLQKSLIGDTDIDKVALATLLEKENDYEVKGFRQSAASDEMILNGPGCDIPTINFARFPYPEYHTSSDTPKINSESQLQRSLDLILSVMKNYEANQYYALENKGPIFLSKYNLFNWAISHKNKKIYVDNVMALLNGKRSILEIYSVMHKNNIKIPISEVHEIIEHLQLSGLIKKECSYNEKEGYGKSLLKDI